MSTDVYVHGVIAVSVEYKDFNEDMSFTVCDITATHESGFTVFKLFLPLGSRPIQSRPPGLAGLEPFTSKGESSEKIN